jgi:hypothetical protein
MRIPGAAAFLEVIRWRIHPSLSRRPGPSIGHHVHIRTQNLCGSAHMIARNVATGGVTVFPASLASLYQPSLPPVGDARWRT